MANTKVTGDVIANGTISTVHLADNAVTSDKISGITTAHITEGSNLYYTDARADARVALIVDSAPATLDTLNELAAALGDDPNFATTTANSIGLKAPLASPSFTGNATFGGNVGIGTGNTIYADLEVKRAGEVTLALHNSSAITSGNRGNLAFYNSSVSTVATIRAAADTDNVGTALEFYTRPVGGSLTNSMTIDSSGKSTFYSNEIEVYASSSSASLILNSGDATKDEWTIVTTDLAGDAYLRFVDTTTATTVMSLRDNGNLGIGTNSPDVKLDIRNGELIVRPSATGFGGAGKIGHSSSNAILQLYDSSGNEDVRISTSLSSYFNGGNVGIGTTSPTNLLTINDPNANSSITDTIPSWWGLVIDRAYTTSSTAAIGLIGGTVATGSSGRLYLGNSDNVTHTYIDGGANQMHFAVAGGERMRINSSGNLLLKGTGITSLLKFDSSAYGQILSTSNILYYDIDTQVFRNSAGTSEHMRIDSSGNVGVGTTTPDHPLEVVGVISSADSGLQKSTFANVGNDLVLTANADATNVTANILFKSSGSGGSAVSEKMRIDSSGNVGIGTISATSSSKVTIQAQGGNGTDETALVLRNYSASPYTGYVTQEFEVGTVNMAEISGRRIDINNGEIIFRNKKSGTMSATMIITNSGIIKGQRGNAGDLFFADNSSSAGGGIINYNSSLAQQSNNTSCSHFKGTTQNIASYHLYGNGSSSWSSDSRLKRDIETTRDGYIDDINKLRVVKYKWKNDENSGQQLGLIAQEVEKIFPSLVVDHEDAVGNGETYKSLKYSVLPTILLKGMQEQQKMIQELKAEIELLKTQINN